LVVGLANFSLIVNNGRMFVYWKYKKILRQRFRQRGKK